MRLPSIPADAGKGYGVFEELHGFDTAKALALHLEDAAKTCYGQPFRTFVSELTGRDLCKIPPKSPKFPPRHLGDFS